MEGRQRIDLNFFWEILSRDGGSIKFSKQDEGSPKNASSVRLGGNWGSGRLNLSPKCRVVREGGNKSIGELK